MSKSGLQRRHDRGNDGKHHEEAKGKEQMTVDFHGASLRRA